MESARGRAGDGVDPFVGLFDPHRLVQRDRVGFRALVASWGDHPDLADRAQLGRQRYQAGRVESIVIGDEQQGSLHGRGW